MIQYCKVIIQPIFDIRKPFGTIRRKEDLYDNFSVDGVMRENRLPSVSSEENRTHHDYCGKLALRFQSGGEHSFSAV